MQVAPLASAEPPQRLSLHPSRADDAELMTRCAGGDTAALATLYDRHSSVAYSVAMRITGNGRDAEDVVQDAFMGLWRRAASFDPEKASTRTWLFAIVHHRSIDCLRRRRGPTRSVDPEGTVPSGLQVEDIASGVLDRHEGEHLWSSVRRLPDVQRLAIELAFGRGLSHQEVADVTGVPLGTAKSRVRLGLARLRQRYEALDRPAWEPKSRKHFARTGVSLPDAVSGSGRGTA